MHTKCKISVIESARTAHNTNTEESKPALKANGERRQFCSTSVLPRAGSVPLTVPESVESWKDLSLHNDTNSLQQTIHYHITQSPQESVQI